jgi:TonB-linked SusC/RagA family outer membrane protein
MAFSQLFAQTRNVSGTITDEKGAAIPYASITVKGTTIGAQTNDIGVFTLTVPTSSKALIVSSLNFASKEVTIPSSGTVNVVLKTDTKDLDAVVVTALGITKTKRTLGYTTQTIKSEAITDKGDVNVINTLQGKVAGVEITGASGSAGASSNIILRGISSFTGNNQPLFVVDGIPISNDVDNSLNTLYGNQPASRAMDLNINNIESMDIMQGPAAAALYGSRAAHGAIIITTKKGSGKKGVVNVSYNTAYTTQKVYGFPELQNQYGQGTGGVFNSTSTSSWGPAFGSKPTLANGLIVAPGTTPVVNGKTYNPGDTIAYQAYPDNLLSYFQTGTIWENNLTINGGDSKNNYGLALGNTQQKGIMPNSEFDRTNVQFSASSALTDKLSVSGAVTYFMTKQIGVTQGNGANSAMFGLYGVTRSTNLAYYKDHYKNADGTNNWWVTGRDNPYYAAYEDPITSNLTRTLGNVKVSYDALKWLNVSYRLGVDAYTDRRKRIVAISSSQATNSLGSVMEDEYFRSEINGDLMITAKKNNLFTNGLNATFLVGQNFNDRRYQNVTVIGKQLTIPGYYNVANATDFNSSNESSTQRRLEGFYGQASFGYNNYLFLELTGRMDKSSTLPEGNNKYFYPSISSSFIFTDAFHIKSDVLSFGKLRASYAKVGNDANPYLLNNTYSSWSYGNNTSSISFPYGSVSGFGASTRIASPNLKPEFTTSYEFGTSLGFLKNRLNLDFTYYDQVSKDQIMSVAIPTSTGYDSRTTNVGKMTNKGVEITLGATPIENKNFSWNISANFSRNRNIVVDIAPGVTSFQIPGNVFSGVIPSIVVGQPYGVIMGSKYPRNPNGELLVDSTTGAYLPTISNQQVANPNRDWMAGLTNTFKYKQFTLSVLVDYKKGGDLMSWTVATLRSNGSLKETGVDRDQPRIMPGVIQTGKDTYVKNYIQIPAQTYWANLGSIGGGEFTVFDATTFRVREVSLSYDLFGNAVKTRIFKNIKFTVYGRNLFYYAPNSPIDPEVNTQGAGNIRGMELQSAPNTRNFGASLRVAF